MLPIRSVEPGENPGLGESRIPYEPPILTPIGCLHDLLAGGATQNCDGTAFIGATGGLTHTNAPVPPGCV